MGSSSTPVPSWSDLLCCSECHILFDGVQRRPITLLCGHSICRLCVSAAPTTTCSVDKVNYPEETASWPDNVFLLAIIGYDVTATDLTTVQLLAMASWLCRAESERGGSVRSDVLSRSVQKKLVSVLVGSQLAHPAGRLRAARGLRALLERVVAETTNHDTKSTTAAIPAQLWSAVRARGCQFLGPAMQEDVLRLILLALERAEQISRKTLVMYVVQCLEQDYPQVSKTSVGHVVQILYRASCFHLVKRDGESSLMQLKPELRDYDALRREHDAQIMGIAAEVGIRLTPDQWSTVLYGDRSRRTHMQSLLDRVRPSPTLSVAVALLEEEALRATRPSDWTRHVQALLPLLANAIVTIALLDLDDSEVASVAPDQLASLATEVRAVLDEHVRFVTARTLFLARGGRAFVRTVDDAMPPPSPFGVMNGGDHFESAFRGLSFDEPA